MKKYAVSICLSTVSLLLVHQASLSATIVASGVNNRGQTDSSPDSDYVKVFSSCHSDHSIAMKADGSLVG